MSATKEYWFQLQQDEKDAWIRERLGNVEADESTAGWEALSLEYDVLQENRRQAAELEEELRWYEEFSRSEMYSSFLREIGSLKTILELTIEEHLEMPLNKMVYAHAVTLLESFLGDTIKSLVQSDENLLLNAITKVDDISKLKFSLKEILTQGEGAIGFVIKELSALLYHNIPKTIKIYEAVLGAKIDAEIGKLDSITSIRHDIVHRNGKTKEGAPLVITKDIAKDAIRTIEQFVDQLHGIIHERTADSDPPL